MCSHYFHSTDVGAEKRSLNDKGCLNSLWYNRLDAVKSGIDADGGHLVVYVSFLEVCANQQGEPGSCSVLVGSPTSLTTPFHSMDR